MKVILRDKCINAIYPCKNESDVQILNEDK